MKIKVEQTDNVTMSSSLSVISHVLPKLRGWLENGPCVVGISGAQGIGKSTLCQKLVSEVSSWGRRAVSVSIDDFYLTRAEQEHLSQFYVNNTYLQQRGYPGTHDIQLGTEVLRALKNLRAGEEFLVPSYDKSTFGGKGDRALKSTWKKVVGPIDLILFEGWMLGFEPLKETGGYTKPFCEINTLLYDYKPWWDLIQHTVFLDPDNIQNVVEWRIEAEEKMKSYGKAGMTRTEVEAYVKKFLIAYEAYLPAMRARFQKRESQNGLYLKINKHREVIL